MFDPHEEARAFGVPLGVDFPQALVDGLLHRMSGRAPEDMANVELFVNTARMRTRVRELFEREARILPRLRLIGDLSQTPVSAAIPAAVPTLKRRLELRQLIVALLEKEPDLAPRSAAFDLADSLATLMDEMHGEGVPPEKLQSLDVGELSNHWQRSLTFISLVEQFFGDAIRNEPDAAARQRLVVEHTINQWQLNPPNHPIIVAGSTGSRGATRLLMDAVAKLPQGALVLSGFDYDMPDHAWAALGNAMSAEDHPQYRFAHLLSNLDLLPSSLERWTAQEPYSTPRNKLVSLALRPAPVTDQWQAEGRVFEGVSDATKQLALIETSSRREEALSIAILLRKSVSEGIKTALITPDRKLTRQVAALLDRWNIEPDDSGGRPLALSAPGTFLRMVAQLFVGAPNSELLLSLLKHPLTSSTKGYRGNHLRWTRDLELEVLRGSIAPPSERALKDWTERYEDEPDRAIWAQWVADCFLKHELTDDQDLSYISAHHRACAEAIAAGPGQEGSGELWEKPAGQSAIICVTNLAENAEFGGRVSAWEYEELFLSLLNGEEVRNPQTPHPLVMFWGTMEARVQGAERVILAGLNDGTWPELPGPDPWLNRVMRHEAGLLLPERRVGLSAHDFQMAIAAKDVFLTRSKRDDGSETVPSRWLNRLVNLMGGMSEAGATALAEMRGRGDYWVDLAKQFDAADAETEPASRPSPAPPPSTRPTMLSATSVTRLIRDPYAIYADKVLHLRPLDPLRREADMMIRGTIFHKILELFVRGENQTNDAQQEEARLLRIAKDVLAEEAPWPTIRELWMARLQRLANWFVTEELKRRDGGENIANEVWGQITFEELGFTLGAKADRIDQHEDGTLEIFDYKTGTPPSPKMQKHFDKQLLLEAVIAQEGGFKSLPAARTSAVTYIGLNPQIEASTPLDTKVVESTKSDFLRLIRAYFDPDQGYTSRRAMHMQRFAGDYDHLARFGEWDDSDTPEVTKVGQ